MKYSGRDRIDKEVDQILMFISDYIKSIADSEGRKLKDFAKLCGVAQENLTRYKKYGESISDGERHDPHLRTFYKILRGLLGRPPISLQDPLDLRFHKIKLASERDPFGIFDKILALLLSDLDLADLSKIIDIYYKHLEISPRKTGESD